MGASRAQWPIATGICRLTADGGSDSLADRQVPIVALQPEIDNIDVRRESISSLRLRRIEVPFSRRVRGDDVGNSVSN
jgi:hypothetical protein